MVGSRTKATVLRLVSETFFAVLPLFMMMLVWLMGSVPHAESMHFGPEISMTSCVLYGLGLSKLVQGSIVKPSLDGTSTRRQIMLTADAHNIISLWPMVGIIFSIIIMQKSLFPGHGFWFNTVLFINLVASIITFFIVGGYGIRRAETQIGE